MADRTTKRGRESTTSSSSVVSKRPRRSLRVGQQKYGPSHRGKSTDPKVLQKLALFPQRENYDASEPNFFLLGLPIFLWDHVIVDNFGLKDLARTREVCKFFEPFWCDRFENNKLPLRVPRDVSNIKRAVEVVAVMLSERGGSYTKENPLKVMLGEGVHRRQGGDNNTISVRSSMTLSGASREKTIVEGYFRIEGTKEDHVGFETMTVRNEVDAPAWSQPSYGLWGRSGASMHATDVLIDGCGGDCGVVAVDTPFTLTDCHVVKCAGSGIGINGSGVIHIYGAKTTVSGNCRLRLQDHYSHPYGLKTFSSSSKIIIHTSPNGISRTLTKHFHNHSDQNWGGRGKILVVDEDDNVIEVVHAGDAGTVL